MERLKKLLEEQQCDVKDALLRCRNNEKMYLELLYLFSEDTSIDRLADAYKNKDMDHVFFYSYTLMGIYMNLGMNRLRKLDDEIVECIREKNIGCLDGIGTLVQSLWEEHHKLADIIRQYYKNI